MISFHSFYILCSVSGVTLDLKKMAKDRVRLSKVTICAVGMRILLLLIKSFLFVPYTAIPILYILFNFYPLPFVKSSFKYSPRTQALSWLLRHNAEKEGFVFLEGGFLPVLEVLKHKRFSPAKSLSMKLSVLEVLKLKRFIQAK